ncbi:MAG: hypothetical protein HYS20_13635 [Rhodocyclales bacterium]|nr:hypothetical protein [Rhodocyclales bacterium]
MHEVNPAGCQHLLVARSPVGQVAACPACGQIHLSLEYLTLRFEAESFRELVGMLAIAQQRLDADPALTEPTPTPTRTAARH